MTCYAHGEAIGWHVPEPPAKGVVGETATPIARSSGRATRPRGFVLVAVIVVFAFAMTLFGLWAKAAVQRHRQTRGHQFRVQAERLAEAGLQRAVARHAINVNYDGETWSVPAGVLHPRQTATVRVRLTPNDDDTMLHIEARAEFPAGALHRAQITRTMSVPVPASGDEP